MVASFALRVSALNGDTEAVTRQLARGRRRGYPGRWIDDVSLRGVNLQKQRELSRELCDGQCPALFLAAYNGHDAIVRLLLHEGADANLPNSSGQTALFAACTGGHEVSVKELLNAGSHVDAAAHDGWTPLHAATLHNHLRVVKLLVEANPNLTLLQDQGLTALELAQVRDYAAVAAVLARHASGQLDTTIVSGTELRAADAGFYSDPYVLLELLGRDDVVLASQRSSVKIKSLNPQWEEHGAMAVVPEMLALRVTVFDYDEDPDDDDDMLGQGETLSIHRCRCCVGEHKQPIEIPLYYKEEPAGMVTIKVRFTMKAVPRAAGESGPDGEGAVQAWMERRRERAMVGYKDKLMWSKRHDPPEPAPVAPPAPEPEPEPEAEAEAEAEPEASGDAATEATADAAKPAEQSSPPADQADAGAAESSAEPESAAATAEPDESPDESPDETALGSLPAPTQAFVPSPRLEQKLDMLLTPRGSWKDELVSRPSTAGAGYGPRRFDKTVSASWMDAGDVSAASAAQRQRRERRARRQRPSTAGGSVRQVASTPHLAAIQMSKAKMGPGNKPRYRRPASGWGPHRVVVGGGGSAALSGGEILHVNDIAYDDLIREGTRGVNAIRMLRKGGWRVYSKVEWRGRGLAQLVSLYAERLAYFRRLCATEAEVATAVFRERVRSFLSGLWRQSRPLLSTAPAWAMRMLQQCAPYRESSQIIYARSWLTLPRVGRGFLELGVETRTVGEIQEEQDRQAKDEAAKPDKKDPTAAEVLTFVVDMSGRLKAAAGRSKPAPDAGPKRAQSAGAVRVSQSVPVL